MSIANKAILQHTPKKKYCMFCKHKIAYVDYKNPHFLIKFVNDQGKILPRRITGLCSKHQRLAAQATKRAKIIALFPYVTDNFTQQFATK